MMIALNKEEEETIRGDGDEYHNLLHLHSSNNQYQYNAPYQYQYNAIYQYQLAYDLNIYIGH